jgi:hypothetical protein
MYKKLLSNISIFPLRKSKKLFSFIASLLVFTIGGLIFLRLTVKADSLIGFNEGYGITVHDSEGSASGTITNAVWKPQSECLSGSCLYFDGSGDYVSFGDESSYDFAAAANWTIDFWFRTGDITSGTRVMVGKYRGDDVEGGYKIYMSSDGKVNFGVDDDNSWGPDDIATSQNAYDDNLWHHLEAVKAGTTSLTLYMDGNRVGSDPSIQATGTLVNDDSFTLGRESDVSSNYYTGFLDELKVHVTTARTADQVKLDYQKNSTTSGSSASFGPDTSTLSNGLVGYWKMDETASWSGTLNEVLDSSGNGNHGQAQGATGGKAYQGAGKFGKGGYFDGTDDYVDIPDSSNLRPGNGSWTVSLWARPPNSNQAEGEMVAKVAPVAGFFLEICGDIDCNTSGKKFKAKYREDSNTYRAAATSSDVADSNWHHLTMVADKAADKLKLYVDGVEAAVSLGGLGSWPNITNTDNLNIGAANTWSQYFTGSLDDVKIWNYALTSEQVKTEFNQGSAVRFGP